VDGHECNSLVIAYERRFKLVPRWEKCTSLELGNYAEKY
jgi:hypothetical protein